MSVDVSIIIVNWNVRDVLRGCLASIDQQTRDVSFEIIVVDNASHDGSAEMIRSEFPRVRLIANETNRGFAAANNQGIEVAAGRYVLLLNPDTVVLDRAIEKTIEYADSHPDVGVVGCQVLESDAKIQRTCFSFPSLTNMFLGHSGLGRVFPRSRFLSRPSLGWWGRDTEMDVDVVSGMYMLVRREAIDQVGPMDDDYFVYAEEADWCYRFGRAGWRRTFTPIAKIIHLDGGNKSTDQVSTKMYVQLQKSLLLYHRKNLGGISWVGAKAFYIVLMLMHAIAWNVRALGARGQVARKRAAQSAAALRFHLFGTEPES